MTCALPPGYGCCGCITRAESGISAAICRALTSCCSCTIGSWVQRTSSSFPKGHAAGAYYVTLWTLGKLTEQDLTSFHKDGTRLSGHPPASGIDEILFATGSLGHGFALASGLALAKCIRGEPGSVFCLTSDGEWNEGSCWETLIFARHRGLDNLTLLVDSNGLQGFGTTREVADLEPLAARFRSFGVPDLGGRRTRSQRARARPADRMTIACRLS